MHHSRTVIARSSATARRRRAVPRSAIELAAVLSVLLGTLAYALHRFVGVGEMPIVLGALLVASIVGWHQPALRAAPRRTGSARHLS